MILTVRVSEAPDKYLTESNGNRVMSFCYKSKRVYLLITSVENYRLILTWVEHNDTNNLFILLMKENQDVALIHKNNYLLTECELNMIHWHTSINKRIFQYTFNVQLTNIDKNLILDMYKETNILFVCQGERLNEKLFLAKDEV